MLVHNVYFTKTKNERLERIKIIIQFIGTMKTEEMSRCKHYSYYFILFCKRTVHKVYIYFNYTSDELNPHKKFANNTNNNLN